MHIRKDDIVAVITGNDAGSTGRVLRVLPDKGKVVVEGINRKFKHMKPNRQNAQGGRLQKEMPIDVSNVMLYCTTCRRGVRVGRRYAADGHKERYCKTKGCGQPLGTLSKPRETYASKEKK